MNAQAQFQFTVPMSAPTGCVVTPSPAETTPILVSSDTRPDFEGLQGEFEQEAA